MSNYRDDTQETAIASSNTWGKMTTIAEEIGYISSVVIVSVLALLSDSAIASDEVSGQRQTLAIEQAVISDTASGKLIARQVIHDKFRIADKLLGSGRFVALLNDSVQISAEVSGHTKSCTVEQVSVTDAVSSINRATSTISDKARITDALLGSGYYNIALEDSAQITDQLWDSVRAIVVDSATAADQSLGIKRGYTLSQDSTKIKEQLSGRLKVRLDWQDALQAKDSTQTHIKTALNENAQALDQVFGQLHAISTSNDKARVRESWSESVRRAGLLSDVATIRDSASSLLRATHTEQAGITGQAISRKFARVVTSEQARVGDSVNTRHSELTQDSAGISEQWQDLLKAKGVSVEQAGITDGCSTKLTILVSDSGTVTTSTYGQLFASSLSREQAFILDTTFDNYAQAGFAWTAGVDGFAMSRYTSYPFEQIAVINHVLYGVGKDGLYRLDAKKPVQASIKTGKLDLGQGRLVHPLGAYLEYELSGQNKALNIGVGTTQSGDTQTYYYPLPPEPSEHLTNGRVMFGRGLRGRHFSFVFNITGERGYLNDLSIDLAATQRRV